MKKVLRASGQSLIEFAFVFPLILLIIILFIEFGRIVYYHSALYNAVREGTRYAIANQFPNSTERALGIQQKVVDYAIALPIVLDDVSVYCERDPLDLVKDRVDPCNEYVTVSAQIEIEPMVAFLAQIFGDDNTFNITAESTMQMTPYGAYVE